MANDPKPNTPAKPTESGSRQQTHKDQSTQTGSRELDEQSTRGGGERKVPLVPPGAK